MRTRRLDPIWLIVALMVVAMVVFELCDLVPYNYDVASFRRAAKNMLAGQIDLLRTPIYPIITGLCYLVAGESWQWVAIVVQSVAFVGALFAFRELCRRIISTKWLQWTAVTAFALCPQFIIYNLTATSESLAVTAVVCWMWLMLKFFDAPSSRRAWQIGAMMLAMVMLRPSMLVVILTIGVVVLMMLCIRRLRRQAGTLALSLIIPVVGCACWAAEVHRHTGLWLLSTVTVTNDYQSMRMAGYVYDDLLADDPGIADDMRRFQAERSSEYIDNCSTIWAESYYMIDNWGIDRMSRYNTEVKLRHTRDWLSVIVMKARLSCTGEYLENVIYYAIALAFTMLMAVAALRRRAVGAVIAANRFNALLTVYTLGSIAMVIVGAQYDWTRLLVPTIPALLLMAAQIAALVAGRTTSGTE